MRSGESTVEIQESPLVVVSNSRLLNPVELSWADNKNAKHRYSEKSNKWKSVDKNRDEQK